MKTGNIKIIKDDTGLRAEWESPVCYLSYAFMGRHVEIIHYATLRRFHPNQPYRRVVNKDWFWWWAYWAWDWLAWKAERFTAHRMVHG